MRIRGFRVILAALAIAMLLPFAAWATGGDIEGLGGAESGKMGPQARFEMLQQRAVDGIPLVGVWADIEAYRADTGKSITSFDEAPMLSALVASGDLPPVEDRIPSQPRVLQPVDGIGEYGGVMRQAMTPHPFDVGKLVNGMEVHAINWANDMSTGPQPGVFRSWVVNSDASVYTFALREGMKWSDGVTFDADSVLFYYNARLLNATLSPNGRGLFKGTDGQMARLDKLNDYTVRFTFNGPNVTFLEQFARSSNIYLPEQYLAQFHEDYNSDIDDLVEEEGFESWTELWESKMDVWGAGYMGTTDPDAPTIAPWHATTEKGAIILHERNPYYWEIDTAGNQLPYIDGWQSVRVPDQEGIILKTIAGDTDMSWIFGDPTLIRENEGSGNYMVTPGLAGPGFTPTIFFNLAHNDSVIRELFNDKRFRIALSVGMDREEINEIQFNGFNIVTQAGPADGPPYHGEAPQFHVYTQHDTLLANRLLDDMGLDWNASRTVRTLPDGSPAEFVVHVNNSQQDFQISLVEMIKQYWAEIGIEISVNPRDWDFITERVAANEFDMFVSPWATFGGKRPQIVGTRSNLAPNNPGDSHQASRQWTMWLHSDGEDGVEPPDAFKLLYRLSNDFLVEPDPQERLAIEKAMLAIQADNIWMLVVTKTPAIAPIRSLVFSDRMRNLPLPVPTDINYGHPSTWWIAE